MQYFGRFFTTSDFDGEYLRKGLSCPKSENTIINYNPFHVGQTKIGELWSTNNRVKVAHIDQPKWAFFGRLHFALRGCCVLKFLHTLEIDQSNLAHTPTGTPKKSNRKKLKFRLKFSVLATITPDLVGVSS